METVENKIKVKLIMGTEGTRMVEWPRKYFLMGRSHTEILMSGPLRSRKCFLGTNEEV